MIMNYQKKQGLLLFRLLVLITLLIFLFLKCSKDTPTNSDDDENGLGFLFISSNPQGYQIILNNENTGKFTPDTLKYLETGTKQIRLESDIYCDSAFTVTIRENEITTLFVDFTQSQRFYGKIDCSSSPGNCLIILDDSSTQNYTPHFLSNIYPGSHKVEFKREGYASYIRNLSVNSDETKQVQGTLQDTTVWRLYNPVNSGIASSNLTSITCNINGDRSLWIGSSDNGVSVFNNGDWTNYNSGNSQIPSNNITCLENDARGYIWIGTDNGLAIYKGSDWEVYSTRDTVFLDTYITDIGCVSHFNPNSIIAHIGTMSGGLIYYHYNLGWFNFNPGNSEIPSYTINSVWSGEISNFFLAGTENGFYKGNVDTRNPNIILQSEVFTRENSPITSNRIDVVSRREGSHDPINVIMKDLWAVIKGSDNTKVFVYSSTGWAYFVYTTTFDLNFEINRIYQLNSGSTWFATNQGAVFMNDYVVGQTINTSNSILPSNNVRATYVDIYNNLWIATDNGLVKHKL